MKTLMVGQTLYGYCGGYFGRDSYSDKRIEAVGYDWIVVREENGSVNFVGGKDVHNILAAYTEKSE